MSLVKENGWTKDKEDSRGAFQRRMRVNLISVGEVQMAKVRRGRKNVSSRENRNAGSDEKLERCGLRGFGCVVDGEF